MGGGNEMGGGEGGQLRRAFKVETSQSNPCLESLNANIKK